jgi:hypothetical protein
LRRTQNKVALSIAIERQIENSCILAKKKKQAALVEAKAACFLEVGQNQKDSLARQNVFL